MHSCNERTMTLIARTCTLLRDHFGGQCDVAAIDAEAAAAWRLTLYQAGLATTTAARHVQRARHIWQVLKDRRLIEWNPFDCHSHQGASRVGTLRLRAAERAGGARRDRAPAHAPAAQCVPHLLARRTPPQRGTRPGVDRLRSSSRRAAGEARQGRHRTCGATRVRAVAQRSRTTCTARQRPTT
jgi:hypothetical protein